MNALNPDDWPPLAALPRDTFTSPSALVGVPYVRGGVTPAQGFDCFTLVSYVRWHWFRRQTPVGQIPKRKLSPAAACALCMRRAFGREGDPVRSPWQKCEAREGCVVALGNSRLGRLHHCGVWFNGGVLHCLENVGVCWTPGERLGEVFKRVECYELCAD